MAEPASQAAVLFAQLSASVGLNQLAAEPAGHAALENAIALTRDKTVKAGGREVKRMRYKMMFAFPNAETAADAAIEMQTAFAQLPAVAGARLGISMGFNYGPVLPQPDGDVFGDAVNLAARVADVATDGQIIVPRETVTLLPPMLKASTRLITAVQMKGKAEPVQVYELIWQQSAEMTAMAAQKSMVKVKQGNLRLLAQGSELVLSAERPSITLGRDPAANIVIRERAASRAHGKIEVRLDKFILTDHSANGTFVTFEGLNEIILRREELTLRGHGWIAFGQPRATATDVVEFFAE